LLLKHGDEQKSARSKQVGKFDERPEALSVARLLRDIRDMHKPLSTGETAERGFWIESKNLIAWARSTK
jgi:hypothetical protein